MLIIRHLTPFISQVKGPFQFLINIKEVKVCEPGLKQGVCIVKESANAPFTQKSNMFGLHRESQS